MEKGKVVNIYYDPLTKQELEGRAKLLKHYKGVDTDDSEYWDVKFLCESEDFIVKRWIRKEA